MNVYLPIAEISVNLFVILGLGTGIGVLSGIFGVGGGFLITPLLIFLGVPSAVAVGTGANQIVASSISGVFAHWKRGNVDVRMGVLLLLGGLAGSTFGTWLFAWLTQLGQIDLIIKLSYVGFLGIIGGLMMLESVVSLLRAKGLLRAKKKSRKKRGFQAQLPLKMRFPRSKLYISALLPLGVGAFVGMLSAIMGVGGGFVMVPAMVYLLGMPTAVVIGTSLFQIIFVTANTTFFQAYLNQTVDVVLATLLLVGGVIGAQVGARLGAKLPGEQLRALLAALVLLVCFRLGIDLIVPPEDIYSFTVLD